MAVRDGASTACTATADDSGAWSCASDGGFTAGRQTIAATVTDPTGLTGTASAAIGFTASDEPPGTAVVGAVLGAG